MVKDKDGNVLDLAAFKKNSSASAAAAVTEAKKPLVVPPVAVSVVETPVVKVDDSVKKSAPIVKEVVVKVVEKVTVVPATEVSAVSSSESSVTVAAQSTVINQTVQAEEVSTAEADAADRKSVV